MCAPDCSEANAALNKTKYGQMALTAHFSPLNQPSVKAISKSLFLTDPLLLKIKLQQGTRCF